MCEDPSQFPVDPRSKDYDTILPGSTSIRIHVFFSYYIVKISDELEAITKMIEMPSPILQMRRGNSFVPCLTKGWSWNSNLGIHKCLSPNLHMPHPANTQSCGIWVKCKTVSTAVHLDILRKKRHWRVAIFTFTRYPGILGAGLSEDCFLRLSLP